MACQLLKGNEIEQQQHRDVDSFLSAISLTIKEVTQVMPQVQEKEVNVVPSTFFHCT